MLRGCFSSGFQKVTSLIQQASFITRSQKLKASNISIVRQAMPSAWPSCSGPSFCSTMQVRMSAKRRQLRRQRQPGRAAADDQHVHLRRRRIGVRGGQRGGVGHMGITGLEAVQMKLHRGSGVGVVLPRLSVQNRPRCET